MGLGLGLGLGLGSGLGLGLGLAHQHLAERPLLHPCRVAQLAHLVSVAMASVAMVSVAIVSIATASTAHVVAQLERVVPVRAEAASLGRAAKLRGHKVCLVCEDLVCLERRLRIPRE